MAVCANAPARQRGVMAVEFSLFLFVGITFFALIGEFLRVSLFQQMLARSFHAAARAVTTLETASGCEAAVETAIRNDRIGSWLFDQDGDGTVSVDADTTPLDSWPSSDDDEVEVLISWDSNPEDGVDWSDGVAGSCGGTSSWLRLRAQITLRPWFGPFRMAAPAGLMIREESWGRNVRA